MNPKSCALALCLVSGLMFAGDRSVSAQQQSQVEFPAPSPACTLKQRVGLTDIEVVYSRPGAKGRQIFGGLVPYGAVWRTGANQATRITFSTAIKFNGANVPAGTYGLFTIPGENEWTIILNKGSNQWGAYRYDEKEDFLRTKVTPVHLAEQVETFLINIDNIRDESANLQLIWEDTVVPVPIEVELTSTLVPQIEKAMASEGGRKPYFQAAMFYYNHGQDLQKAKKWINTAVTENEAFYTVHWKAKILARLGEKEDAIAAAKRSSELAVKAEGPQSGYVKMNEDLIASLQR